MFKKYKKKILFSAAIGALIFLAFSIYADLDNLLEAFKSFNWLLLPVVLILSFMNYLVRFYKWEYYRKMLNIVIETKISFLIFLSAFVMSVTPGKMGEVLKSFLLKEENGTPIERSAPILIAERLTDFLSIVLICLAGAFVFDYGKEIVIIIGFGFIVLAFTIANRRICESILKNISKISFVKPKAEKLYSAYESIYVLVKIRPLLFATFISVFGWFFECFGFYLILKSFSGISEININILNASFIYGFATLVGAVVMLPGGLGVTEASLTGLMQILAIPKNVSVASTILIRACTLWFAVLVGVFAVFIYQKVSNRDLSKIKEENLIPLK